MFKRLVAVVAVLVLASAARADVKLPAIFGDNMVLQRDAKVNIWGWAQPGEKVTVVVGAQSVAATADADGRWKLELAPIKAGGPVEVTVSAANTITLKNVLVGDVWLGSGQSNMTMAVAGCLNAAAEIAAATQPDIRLFTVPQKTSDAPQADCAGQWVVCSPRAVNGFSASLYFFGRDLRAKLGVPMGLVHSSWGGTPIEAWTGRAAYEGEPKIKPILEKWDAARKVGPGQPTCLYNAMIAPLLPLTVKGVIWYQGESNAGNAALYQTQMPTMIADWRKQFGQNFPFFQVQLANFHPRLTQPEERSWSRLREAQLKTWLADPKTTGMAVIIDAGDAKDIHPKNKQAVGARLALAARAIAYGEKDLVYSGPVYTAMKVEGNKVRLAFDHVGGGLVTRQRADEPAVEGKVPLHGFAIAGADKKFVWAEATIEGNDVVVSSREVANPVAVRYGWANNPDCNLYNKEGLPATPFRTDDW